MTRVHVERREGTISRVPRGRTPVIGLDLGDHQRVVSADLRTRHEFSRDLDRKTVDWVWTVYVESWEEHVDED